MKVEEAKAILDDVSAYLASLSLQFSDDKPDDKLAGHSYINICKAIKTLKSLDVLDKIVELINTRYGYILKATKYGNEDAEHQSFSYTNVLMYEVADILDDILDDIEECRKEIEE